MTTVRGVDPRTADAAPLRAFGRALAAPEPPEPPAARPEIIVTAESGVPAGAGVGPATARTILLAEGEVGHGEIVARAVRRAGADPELELELELEVLCNGRDVLDRLLGPASGPLPGLVLLDLHLPDRSAQELLLELRRDPRTASIPIVVANSWRGGADEHALLRCGADSVLGKPRYVDDYIDLLRHLFERRFRPRSPAPAGG